MASISDLTIKKFHDGLIKKEFSAVEITQELLRHARQKNDSIGAYLKINEDSALEEARLADEIASHSDSDSNPLLGVPLAIKDNILIQGQGATAGSKILKEYIASYDAGVIKKLKEQGAVFLGKTNLDEFAMGSSTENSAFQPTRNPHNLDCVPGGSSGGSAAAVAADMAIAGLGSDTGGSIRQPAAFCGVVGLKPTYGAVSRSGLVAMASSLDQIGPLTKTVEDAALLFQAIQGHDPMDATSVKTTYADDLINPDWEKIKSLTVGLPEEYFVEGLDNSINEAIESTVSSLQNLGVKFKKVSMPHTKYALSCYYIIMPAEVSANLARFDGIRYARIKDLESRAKNLGSIYTTQRGEGFGTEVKRRIILGSFVLSSGYYDAYYSKAQKVRTLMKNDFEQAFSDVDVLLTPVTPTTAFKFGEKTDDPLAMYLSDVFTIPASMAGLPALSLPTRTTSKENLPIGFQLIGQPFREADILGMGRLYEQAP